MSSISKIIRDRQPTMTMFIYRAQKFLRAMYPLHGIQVAGLVTAGVSTCVIALAIFMVQASLQTKVDGQRAADSDNIQWFLAQTEVDLAKLHVSVLAALNDEFSDLQDLRRRFDIFFSRIRINVESDQLKNLREQEETASSLSALTQFLARHEKTFDGSPQELRAALPQILADLEDLESEARRFSVSGISRFSIASDTLRREIGYLLSNISTLTLFMVFSYFVVVLLFLRLIHLSGRSERKAADSRNQLQEVISSAIDGVLTVDIYGRIIDYNGAAERIFGYRREEAVGQAMSELIIPDHLRAAHEKGMARYRRSGENRVVGNGLLRLEAKRKNGEVFPVELAISAVQTTDRTVFVSYIRDISNRVIAEKELVDARDRAVAGENAKADLLAVMSHEMRTPLNGLMGTLELLRSLEMREDQQRYFAAMETSAKLLLHHVDGVLMVSMADAGKLRFDVTDLSVKDFLRELVESQRQSIEANGNRIIYDARNAPDTITIDSLKLWQIILNLVGNANKFTKNGEITVDCDRLSDGKSVEFRVTDTGVGIAAESLDLVFEDFRTLDASYGRRAEGSGLGLSISRRLTEAMGGEIGIESEFGVGTVAWVRLPIAIPQASDARADRQVESAAENAETKSPSASMRVLLVEDNEINRLVAMDMLKQEGHRVDVACDGVEGVEMADKTRYDLILMDISMPELDGIEATEMIRATCGPNRNTPILALTAHALPDDLARFRKVGIEDTIVKPLNRTLLSRMLATHASRLQPNAGPGGNPVHDVISVLASAKGPSSASALVDAFIADMNFLLEKITAQKHNAAVLTELGALAHKCAGSASVLGIEDIGELLRELENIVNGGEGDMPSCAGDIERAWKAASDALVTRKEAVLETHEQTAIEYTRLTARNRDRIGR